MFRFCVMFYRSLHLSNSNSNKVLSKISVLVYNIEQQCQLKELEVKYETRRVKKIKRNQSKYHLGWDDCFFIVHPSVILAVFLPNNYAKGLTILHLGFILTMLIYFFAPFYSKMSFPSLSFPPQNAIEHNAWVWVVVKTKIKLFFEFSWQKWQNCPMIRTKTIESMTSVV